MLKKKAARSGGDSPWRARHVGESAGGRGKRLVLEMLEPRRVLGAGPLAISEFMAVNDGTYRDQDGDFSDWIEIYNPTESHVDLAGWHLTDEAGDLTKWQFPPLALRSDEYLVVFASDKDRTDAGELHTNFRLAGEGEYLALVRPDGETVADEFAPSFPRQFSDVSYGLFSNPLDVGSQGTELAFRVPTEADAALATDWTDPQFNDSAWDRLSLPPRVLITEADTGRPDALEIQNLSGSLVDTSGWVVATNHAREEDINSVTEVVWELPSSMAADEVLHRTDDDEDGEFYFGGDIFWRTAGNGWVMIVDDRGTVVDFVVWGYSPTEIASLAVTVNGFTVRADGVWTGAAVPADGETSNSLQRRGTKDRDNVSDWAFVEPESLGQQNADLIAPFAPPSAPGLGFDLAQTGLSGAIQVDVAAGMHGVNASLWTRIPFEAANSAVLKTMELRMRYDDGFVAYINGTEVARRNGPESARWNSQATAKRSLAEALQVEVIDISDALDLLLPGTNVLAVQALNFAASDDTLLLLPELAFGAIWYVHPATPGLPSSDPLEFWGPAITNVTENPPRPAASEDLLITAKVLPQFGAMSDVQLRYRVMFGQEQIVAMADDGLGADAAADDSVYSAVIPHETFGPGEMVRWYVTAEDVHGYTSREPLWSPPFVDRKDTPEYFGTAAVDPNISTKLPVMEWFVEKPEAARGDAGTRASVLFDGLFYDNFFVRRRGWSTLNWPKRKFKFDFNSGDYFRYSPDQRPVEEFNFLSHYREIGATSYMRENLAYEWMNEVGVAAPLTFHVHLRQNGNFYGLYSFVEQIDETFLERNGFNPDGAMYKALQNGTLTTTPMPATNTYRKATQKDEPWTDFREFVVGLSGSNRFRFVFDNVDVAQLVNEMASQTIATNHDRLIKNYYMYREPETLQWHRFPWDMDQPFAVGQKLRGDPWANVLFGDTQHVQEPGNANWLNYLLDAILDNPVSRQMYVRRLRTLMDEYHDSSTGYFEGMVNRYYDLIQEEAHRDNAIWGAGNIDVGYRAILNENLPTRRAYLLADPLVPDGQAGNPAVTLGTVVYNPATGNQDEEYIELVNPLSVAVDISGWRLDGAVDFSFQPGTVIPSHASLYVTPSVIAFRQRATSPSGGMSLFVQGNYTEHLSNLQGILRLVAADGELIDEVDYEGEPSPYLKSLRITEINYNPYAPTMEETAAGLGDNDDFEFIELANVGTEPLELAGVGFVDGISFAFEQATVGPGEQVLLVRNQLAFETRYGMDLPVIGRYEGRLDNGGEQLVLIDPFGEPIADFRYDDGNDWPTRADGGGPTLAMTDPAGVPVTEPQRTAFLEDPAHWHASAAVGGTPGHPADPAEVIGRYVFYNYSRFDGDDPITDLRDDDAVAPDKQALLPGQTATFLNYTSYVRGINGIMVDVAGLTGIPMAEDFAFRVGNDDDPNAWPAAPAPQDITVRPGAGANGSDRVTIVWADSAIARQWLQVTVLATVDTALAADDVFYFGNAIGEAGNSAHNAIVNTTDEVVTRNFQHGPSNLATIDDPFDYDRDRLVNATDRAIARSHQTGPTTALRLISPPADGAAAEQAAEWKLEEPEISVGEADWLRELVQLDGNDLALQTENSVKQAVDVLLTEP